MTQAASFVPTAKSRNPRPSEIITRKQSPKESSNLKLCKQHLAYLSSPILFLASSNEDEDDGDDEIDLSGQDWRTFRAKLVMGSTSAFANLSKTTQSVDSILNINLCERIVGIDLICVAVVLLGSCKPPVCDHVGRCMFKLDCVWF